MTTTTNDLIALRDELRAIGSAEDGRVWLTATFDLRPGPTGEPSAPIVMKDALAHAAESLGTAHRDQQEEAFRELLASEIETATAAGATGLLVAAPLEGEPRVVATETPFRNRVDIGDTPWLFEVERLAALSASTVAVAHVDRSAITLTVVDGPGPAAHHVLQGDPHDLQDAVGRTNQHGRGGSAEMPAGGHGKTGIERSAEEHREGWAREAAEWIAERAPGADQLFLGGSEEPRARVAAHLGAPLAERAEQIEGLTAHDSEEDRVERARTHARESQYRHAATLAEAVLSGAHGERGLREGAAIAAAASEGRLATLIVNEDGCAHYGDAADARNHEPRADEAELVALLSHAVAQAAEIWFVRDELLLDESGGAVGITRW